MQHQHKTEKIKKLTNFASDAIINSRNMWYYQLEKGVPIFYTGTQILLPRVSERIDIMHQFLLYDKAFINAGYENKQNQIK